MSSIIVRVRSAVDCPRKDLFSESDVYVVIDVIAKGAVSTSAQSAVARNTKDPVWDADHTLASDTEWEPQALVIKFSLYDKDPIGSEWIGEAEISIVDFIATPEVELLVHDASGNPVLSTQSPHWPCMLSVSLDVRSCPSDWPLPPQRPEPADPQGHVLMITRGTRGDVQPFVALARGMAKLRAWRVTICTELRWRSFVLDNAADVSPGEIRYLDSGGDTERKVNSCLGQWATRQKSEFLQLMMLARSEVEFFNSATVIMRHLRDLQKGSQPVSMLVYGLTLTGVGLMAGEYFKIPAISFNLQPSSLPSQAKEWTAVQAIDSTGIKALEDFEKEWFTSQNSLDFCKVFSEKNPFTFFNIDKIRGWFGLPPGDTRVLLRERRSPVVIPMRAGTFDRPPDWWDGVITSDFIFLRTGAGGQSSLGGPLEGFVQRARDAGARLGVMTFSSMPISRRTMLACATKMVSDCSFDLRLVYVGKRYEDAVPDDLARVTSALVEESRFLELQKADFGVLFPFMDVFVVHGGLGTTVEALRMKKPTTVTGPLLMDQRFWGNVCHQKGVGMQAVHIDDFDAVCVRFADGALDPADPEGWQAKAREQDWGDTADDGVKTNVDCFAELLAGWSGEVGQTYPSPPPPRPPRCCSIL